MRDYKKEITQDILKKMYIQEEKSVRQISSELKCNPRTIMRRLERYEIQIRGPKESVEWQWRHLSPKRKDYLERGERKFRENPTTKIGKRGYRMIYVPKKGWVREHTYLWELKLGSVPQGMILHHKDFDRLNNSLGNLMLMSKIEHHKLHYAKRIIDRYGRFLPKN